MNSPPDQYVDAVAIDYANDKLVVAARSHGNNVINFWRGNEIKLNKGKSAFQNNITGTKGNLHVGWLGKYGLTDGKIYASTYVAELADGSGAEVQKRGGLLRAWPNPNDGWMDINTTRIHALEGDHLGRACILAIGRRPYTTKNALIENVRPGKGVSAWSPFARIYDPGLADLDYSTIVRGPWNPKTGEGGDGKVELTSILPLGDGILVTGTDQSGTAAAAAGLPTTNVPAWGSAKAGGPANAVLAVLPTTVSR